MQRLSELVAKIVLGLGCILFSVPAFAQLEIVWGDSVLLHVINPPDEAISIQWQQSPDQLEWENIDGAIGAEAWVSPLEDMWFRAEVSDSACEVIYHSDAEFVQVELLMNVPCPDQPIVVDANGNEYPTVQIGGQCWIAANLRTMPATGASWCYGNNPDNCETYGRLYSWAAAMNGELGSVEVPSGVQGVCPSGWHLPSNGEWDILRDYLDPDHSGGTNDAGGKLKSVELWNAPNAGATNESGFSALPGGIRNVNTSFLNLNNQGIWWTATTFGGSQSWQRIIYHNLESINLGPSPVGAGLSVRCIKDE